ncbi:hypothetical protein AAFC00_006839 [Neodothiora populina]|uniref:tRNA wybutosine-synthesizing protein 4 n=1 Tax=Neodothiora populina TaxID=2781224 RepID=A0ABR3PBG5_9PEZI
MGSSPNLDGQVQVASDEKNLPINQPSRPQKSKSKSKSNTPATTKTDEFIMDTNNSSIVSKRSVEKLYYPGQKEYFRYFVRKFQRRSPLINRGYWLRMKAVDSVVRPFLSENPGKKKIVVNLGCGYDPNPFEYLGRSPELCDDVTFVDVDYPQLMRKKHEMITSNAPLIDLVSDLELQPAGSTVIARSKKYLAIGCDLRELEELENVLRQEFNMANEPVSILFTAEVSVAYMTRETSNAVFKWASTFEDVKFCLLEQQIPDGRDHPFAVTMLKHFVKLNTPLHSVGTMDQMRERFEHAGWPVSGISIRSLWELWADSKFLSPQERMDLDKIEPFDEWEEFALFGSHYFLLVSQKGSELTDAAESETSGKADPISSAEAADGPRDEGHEQTYRSLPFQSKPSHRRFAATLPSDRKGTIIDKVAVHGGMGTRERLNNCDTYTIDDGSTELTPPPLPSGLMCHTITTIDGSDCLLIGGRTSPDKVSSSCWYRKNGEWSKVHDLPQGRYRHCAIAVEDLPEIPQGIIVFGGKNAQGKALNDWLLWQPKEGWTKLESVYPDLAPHHIEPRFGAAMTLLYKQAERGFLTGGLKQDGTIVNDFWVFELRIADGRIVVTLENCTNQMHEVLDGDKGCLGRFGALFVSTQTSHLLIGGVAADNLLDRKHEILDVDNRRFVEIEAWHRPLLTGFAAVGLGNESKDTADDILILGGGATAFSFGTSWNDGCLLRLGASEHDTVDWRLLSPEQAADYGKAKATNGQFEMPSQLSQADQPKPPATKGKQVSIPRKTIESAADFELVRNEGRPVILCGVDLGSCTLTWTNDYLKSKVGETRDVVVHSSPTPHMTFQKKNFKYITQPFGSFINAASNGEHLYLRALSSEKPSDKPTNLAEDFPSISDDFSLPESLQYAQKNMHSSPFRISGPVTMWLHYDVMANILCQVRGRKRLLLFSPTDVTKLSFAPGASSSDLNPFTDDISSAQAHEANLEPGEILYIPPVWLHAAEPTEGLSVAVNVFFRDASMETGYAAGRDVYGNRDLAAYERGRRDIQRIAKGFEGVPGDVRTFYLSRLADELARIA